MRVRIVPLFASVALLALPAFAQTGASGPQQPSATTGAANAAAGQTLTKDTEQRIRRSLEQSGFKNVQVMPQAFVIRAEAPDGSRVMMQMSPDRFAELVVPEGQSAATGKAGGADASDSTAMRNGATSGTSGSASTESGSTTAPSTGSAPLQGGSSSAPTAGGDIAQQIRQSLQKNGFKDIEIMPEAFLIRGQAPDGSRMAMVVSPDEAEGIVAPGNRSGASSRNDAAAEGTGTGTGIVKGR